MEKKSNSLIRGSAYGPMLFACGAVGSHLRVFSQYQESEPSCGNCKRIHQAMKKGTSNLFKPKWDKKFTAKHGSFSESED